jgi:hypothetical protein
MIIRGRFDAFEWAADPNRRDDISDATVSVPLSTSNTITGFAGAAGRVERLVRVLDGPQLSDPLEPGEILIAVTTNVGWTPIFPRAAAVVTDVGTRLSHTPSWPASWACPPWPAAAAPRHACAPATGCGWAAGAVPSRSCTLAKADGLHKVELVRRCDMATALKSSE